MTVRPPANCPEEPFRGLEPYRFYDRAVFFERGPEVRKLIQLTTIYRASLLYGESGSGKSSLINAGFIPEILNAGAIAERIRVQPRLDNEFVVERIESAPNQSLPSLLLVKDSRATLSAADLTSRIRRVQHTPLPILIFDQFEEFHTLAADVDSGEALDATQAQQRIVDVLVDLINDPRLPVRLLFVFREDYLAKFDRLFYFSPDLPDRFVRLTAPSPEALPQILRGPFTTTADRLGQQCWDRELSPDLAEKLRSQLRPSAGRGTINLAQVQVAALQLWRSGDPDTALETRGVRGLVEDYQEQALSPFGRDRSTAEALLALMVTKEGTRKVLLETDALDQAKKDDGIPADVARHVLSRLVNETKLVRRDFNRNAVSYEIVNEFLVEWILRLKRLRMARRERKDWLRKAAFAFVSLAVILFAVFLWRYRSTTVQAQAQRLVELYKKRTLTAEKERDEAQKRADDALAILHEGHDEQVKRLSDDLATSQKSIDSQRAEIAKLQQDLIEAQKTLASSKSALDAAQSENRKLRQEIDDLEKPPSLKPQPLPTINSTPSPRAAETRKPNPEIGAKPVTINVKVVDDWNRIITGLDKENFMVTEGNVEQQIIQFSSEDVPYSVGVVLNDREHSIKRLYILEALQEFVKSANPSDEFFLITCDDKARVSVPFTDNGNELTKFATDRTPKGQPRLLDGISLALEEIKNAKYSNRAILLISEGWNDKSHRSFADIARMAQQTEAQINSLVSFDEPEGGPGDYPKPLASYSSEELAMDGFLRRISEQSGGRAFSVDELLAKANLGPDIFDTAYKISAQLRNSYYLTFSPKNETRGESYRRIQVKLRPPPGLPHLNVFFKKSYSLRMP